MYATMLNHTGGRAVDQGGFSNRTWRPSASPLVWLDICPTFAERNPDLGQIMQTSACSRFDEIFTLYEYPAELETISHRCRRERLNSKLTSGASINALLTTLKAERKSAIGEFHPSITTFG
ncbi:hypothetical protein B5K11_34835 [Rhizobium leguminosarum bv. trifolii]|nr:hypothetical protein CO667_34115 [Rhizobium sp. L43]RFB83361.1 hypothetical protein B5K11_34835 [Rhizobium leguminosarum bv. trifolii]